MRTFVLLLMFAAASAFCSSSSLAQLSVRGDLDGTQAGTGAIGSGTIFGTFSADFKSLTYQVTVAKLTGPITGAHFHFAANGNVLQPITFTGNTARGTWTNIPDTLLKYFFRDGIYVNVHTTANPGGEIRGSLNAAQFYFTANLDSTGTGSGSSAKGTGYFRFNDTTGGGNINVLQYHITFAGLSGSFTGAHFHYAPTGAILHAISFPDSATASDGWGNFPDSVITLLLHGKVYVNIHSTTSPGGEIRGTVTPVGSVPFVAAIDSTGTGSASKGTGTAYAFLSPDMQTVSYGATYGRLSSSFTASHFHSSPSGSVIHPLTFTGNSTAGNWTGFTDANLQDLLRGRVYLNIHSTNFPSGEIRGFFQYFDGSFSATLSGAQAGTSSTGTGTAWLHFGHQDSASFRVTFAGLSGTYTGSHFHLAPAGTVVEPIATSDSTTGAGIWACPDSIIASIVRGNVYVNIHSTTNPAGDIRGTLSGSLGPATSVERSSSSVPSAFALSQNFPNPFNPSTSIAFSITKAARVTLRVYNILGQEVATLMDGQQNAGSYKVVFDASKLATGVYLYRLTTSDGITAARKMLLLK